MWEPWPGTRQQRVELPDKPWGSRLFFAVTTESGEGLVEWGGLEPA